MGERTIVDWRALLQPAQPSQFQFPCYRLRQPSIRTDPENRQPTDHDLRIGIGGGRFAAGHGNAGEDHLLGRREQPGAAAGETAPFPRVDFTR